jgi:hypothetical protein
VLSESAGVKQAKARSGDAGMRSPGTGAARALRRVSGGLWCCTTGGSCFTKPRPMARRSEVLHLLGRALKLGDLYIYARYACACLVGSAVWVAHAVCCGRPSFWGGSLCAFFGLPGWADRFFLRGGALHLFFVRVCSFGGSHDSGCGPSASLAGSCEPGEGVSPMRSLLPGCWLVPPPIV